MPIEINLSPEETGDWLASATSGESGDFFDKLEARERNRRAKDAQVEAVAVKLAEIGVSEHNAETVAQTWIEHLDEAEYRDIRRAALNDESDGDYLDRLATKFVRRLCEHLLQMQDTAPQARDARTVITYGQAAQRSASHCDLATTPVAAYMGNFPERQALQRPVVEITEQAELQTADYSDNHRAMPLREER